MARTRTRMPTVTLNDGIEMPLIGFGLADCDHIGPHTNRLYESVRVAIRSGYRLIDLNSFQCKEAVVGRALRDSIKEHLVTRQNLFISAMMYLTNDRKHIVKDCKRLVHSIGLKYIDLFLLSWPALNFVTGKPLTRNKATGQPIYSTSYYTDAWRGMEDCKDQGLVRSIGVVDFDPQTIDDILAAPARHKPSVHLRQSFYGMNLNKLLEDCKRQDIVLSIQCPDSSGVPEISISKLPYVVEDPVFVKLAKKHHKSPDKICLRYLIQSGIAAITQNQTFEQIFENIDVLDFQLSPEDMDTLLKLDEITANYRGYSQLIKLLESNIEGYGEH